MRRIERLPAFLLQASVLVAAPAHASSRVSDASSASVEATTPEVHDATEADGCGAALRTASESGHLEEKASNALFASIGHAIATDVSCKDRVARWLGAEPCTQVHGVVATAAFAAETWEASRTTALVEARRGDVACVHTMLPAVQGAAAVDGELARVLLRTTEAKDQATADGAWMVVGTVGRAARLRGQSDLARTVETRIAGELSRRTRGGRDATALLEAAGNAGCHACKTDISRAMTSKDVRTRRIAVGAFRFSEASGAAAMGCKFLRDDGEPSVRAHAAWSLGWSRLDADVRETCLRHAARNDSSRDVRDAAAQALEQLAGASSDTGE